MTEKKTEKLEFKNFKKYFINTQNIITPNPTSLGINQLNNWIRVFLENVSNSNKNKKSNQSPFYIYGINIRNLDENNTEIDNIFLLYQNPLIKSNRKYIETCFYKKGSKLSIDIYVTFNKNSKKGKLLHLLYKK